MWKAPTTVASGARAWARSAAEPSPPSMTRPWAPRLSKASGLTHETTVLPASGSEATSSSWPSHGTASTTTSASAQASAFAVAGDSAGAVDAGQPLGDLLRGPAAFSATREPITTAWPWRAKR